MEKIVVGIACDHAGYEMKVAILAHLEQRGFKVVDFGTNSEQSVDYPDFAHPLAVAVEQQVVNVGISLCGSGNGINMTMNKHQQIRAALCWTEEISRLARLHNNANVCSLPARFISLDLAKKIVDIFLSTEFEGGRHQKRIEKIPIKVKL
ncbi:MAG TPA: ribose 5-phosphate isomerase B [Williamwhitmania sp.]|nr:ribose 5-phosphate isomerase B [Williamwhitmania sp.]